MQVLNQQKRKSASALSQALFALFSTRFGVPPSTERQNRRFEHPRRRQGSGWDVFDTGKLAEAPEGIVVARAGASGTAL